MKILSKLYSSLFVLSLTWCASAQQSTTTPVTLNKIGDKLYEVAGGRGAKGGAFIGDNGVLLIDAKSDQESVDQTIREIRKITDKPIRFMVNTHSDGDHVTGNRFLPESVVIVAHENCRQEFLHPTRNGEPSSWNDPELVKYIPSVTFSSKMDLHVDAKNVELWYFGVGHTTGDAVVFFPDERIAFIGDQVFEGRVQLIHSYKGGNSFMHVETLTKMVETLDAEKFYSGHSEPLSKNVIRAHIGEMKNLQEKVTGFINDKYTLENIKKEFSEDHGNLVETIYNEVSAKKQIGVGAEIPGDATILFDGSRAMLDENWTYWEGPRLAAELPIKWEILEDPKGEGTVMNSDDPSAAGGLYGSADIVTKQKFRDFRAHVEFLITGPKGNSGVYLQNRYEIQVLDGDSTKHGMGAVINETESPYYAYNGIGEWNAYDICFRAARFKDGKLTEKAMVTLYFNGQKVHVNQVINKVWGGANSGLDGGNDNGNGITDRPGGLKLQAEGHSVLYRNIWIEELDLAVADTDF